MEETQQRHLGRVLATNGQHARRAGPVWRTDSDHPLHRCGDRARRGHARADLDTIHDKRLAAVRSLPKEQRTEIIASGEIDLLTKGTDTLARALDIFAQYPWGDPREQAQRLSAYRGKAKIAEHEGVPLATVAGQALFQHDMQKFEQEIRTRVERHKAIIAKVHQPTRQLHSMA